MSTYKDMQPLLSDGVFPKKPVSSTRSTKTENSYASINSQMIDVIKEEKWNCHKLEIDQKAKEKVISKEINKINMEFDICVINTKKPVWAFIEEFKFKYIILESEKNREQMDSILKQNNYLFFENIYINSEYLK